MKAPFPFFGGKGDIASEVWARLGSPKQYIEPFCGSAAVLLAAKNPASLEVVGDVNGFICLGPDTRILRSDLTWNTAEKISVGDELLAFDENNNGAARDGFRAPTRYRRWRITNVTAVRKIKRPSYRLTFDDGTTVVASSEHMWLCGSSGSGQRGWRWVSTRRMLCGEKQASWVLRVAPVITRDETWESGWIGGLFDGEGHLNGRTGWRLTLAQNPGVTLDRAKDWLARHNFAVTEQTSKKCVALSVLGGMRESFRFLMLARPERLIGNMMAKLPKSSLYGRDHHAVRLVSKENVGVSDVVAIETDCHTFVAEGLASHNCNFWRATIYQPAEVARWADYPVSHIDLGVRHRWLMEQRERIASEMQVHDWPGDAQVAGYWLWGQACWIGSGWCEWNRQRGDGRTGDGQIPHVGDAGRGVQATGKIPHVSDAGRAYWTTGGLTADAMLHKLAARLERVRVIHGDWSRCLNHHYGGDDTAIFFDPPYEAFEGLYHAAPVAQDVAAWCRENAHLRIALCGHRGDYEMDGWSVLDWDRRRFTYGSDKTKAEECIWFSPACLDPGGQSSLFSQMADEPTKEVSA